MPSCAIQTERTITIGSGKVRHVMPMVHVQRLTKEEALEEMREQDLLRRSFGRAWKDDPNYGAFRIDLSRRILRDGMSFAAIADYLEASAPAWPLQDFEHEIRYWRARARGERVCDACYEILPPLPPCDCGCQKPTKHVPGFAILGAPVVPPPASGTGALLSEEPVPGPDLQAPPETPVLEPVRDSPQVDLDLAASPPPIEEHDPDDGNPF